MRKFLAGLCAAAVTLWPIPFASAAQTPVTGVNTNPTLGAACTYTGIQFKTPDNIVWVCADADGDAANEWVVRDLPVCNADPPTSPTCTANTQHVCQIVTAGQFKIYGCDGTDYDLVSGGGEITVDGTTVTYPADFTSDATTDVDFIFNGTSKITGIVVGLQQRAVSSDAPSHGQVLEWDATNNYWHGNTDNVGAPGSGDEITVDGTAVTSPADFTSDATSDVDFIFDLTSTITALVKGLQQRAVASAAPSHGQVLEWDATDNQWEPATDDTGGGGGGDYSKGFDEDLNGTAPQMYTDDTNDRIRTDMDQDEYVAEDMFFGQNAIYFSADAAPVFGKIYFDANNETGVVTVRLCTTDLFMMYDADDDGSYDVGDDYCWGVGGYDWNCDCAADFSYEWATKGIDENADGTNVQLEYDTATDTMLATPDADGTPNFKWVGGAVPKFYVGPDLSTDYSFFSSTAFFGSTGLGISSYQEQLFLADSDGTDTGGLSLGTDRRFAFWTSTASTGYEFDIDGSLDIVGINPDGDATVDYKFCPDNGGALGEVLKMGGSGCIAWGSDLGGGFDADSDGTDEVTSDGTTVSLDPASDGTPAWTFCEDTPSDGELAYFDNAAGCFKAAGIETIQQGRPYRYVELFDDFLRPGSGIDGNTMELWVTSDSATQLHQITNNGSTTPYPSWEDADGTNTVNAIGIAYVNTGASSGNKGYAGFGSKSPSTEPTGLVEAIFQLKKMREFRTRVGNNFVDGSEAVDAIVGGMGECARLTNTIAVDPDQRDSGAYFICQPDLDLDDDGTAGDAEDDNWWAVVDNCLGSGNDTVCLVDGTPGGACVPSANRTAENTGIECTGVSDPRTFLHVLSIEYNGAGAWTFKVDDDTDDSTWDWTSTAFGSITPSDLASATVWGAMMETNQASNKAIYFDYLYYYGIRF